MGERDGTGFQCMGLEEWFGLNETDDLKLNFMIDSTVPRYFLTILSI